jgi:hypothetical protein
MLEYGSIETKPSVKENHTGTVLPSLILNGSNDGRKFLGNVDQNSK